MVSSLNALLTYLQVNSSLLFTSNNTMHSCIILHRLTIFLSTCKTNVQCFVKVTNTFAVKQLARIVMPQLLCISTSAHPKGSTQKLVEMLFSAIFNLLLSRRFNGWIPRYCFPTAFEFVLLVPEKEIWWLAQSELL